VRRAPRLPLEELAPYLCAAPDPLASMAWAEIFGNDRPVEIEVGFGKGMFLVNAATACPEVNFLGIETARKYQLYAAGRMARRGLKNVRVMMADARAFFHACVIDASVRAIHVYFPDPWWKKRHEKRRVWMAEFAADCERVLRPGGMLYAVTDVAEYFEVITALLAGRPKLRPLPPPPLAAPAHDLDYLTNFERKYRKAGRPIHRAVYERI